MILVDVNLLVQATMAGARDHEAARAWLHERLEATAKVGLPWPALTGFVRIAGQSRPQPSARLVSDAHLAAIAIEHGLELCSRDRDFARWADLGLRSRDPLAPTG